MRIRAVIFDWAGTVVDFGCHAPVVVLKEIFARRGVELSPEESRHAMGLLKIDQIRAILQLPGVRRTWLAEHGREPEEGDARELFDSFIPLQMDCIEAYSDVIPGVPELVENLRSAGIKIGSTTGYTRPMLDRLLPKAASQGYAPDCIVTPDQVGKGRPHPWMIFENLRCLDVYPPGACVKVGDTECDMQEALNAGLIAVGVCDSASDAVVQGSAWTRKMLQAAGAQVVLPTAPDLWAICEKL
jgi:phosphonoacetaldehyde hydrolase